jgi:hypothetical protein
VQLHHSRENDLRALKIGFIGAHKSFSTMHRLASLQRQNSRSRAQTVAFAIASLRRHGARKTFKSRCMKPIFIVFQSPLIVIAVNRFRMPRLAALMDDIRKLSSF